NDRTLTLTSGTGAAMTFGDAIGSAQPLAGLTITQSDGVTFNSTLDITDGSPGTLTVTDTEDGSDIIFNGAVTLEAVSFAAAGYDLVFNGSGNTFANATTFQNTGTLNLGNASGDTFVFDAGLTESTTGTVTLAGSIDSTNDDITFGAITLATATTIDTNATDTTGDIIIGAVTGSNNSLTLDTTTSTGSADITFNGDINLGTGALTVTGDVVLGANVSVTATPSSGIGIRFNDAINADSASSNDRTLTLNAGTAATIFALGNVGASEALAGLTVTQSNDASFTGSVDVSDSNSGTITLTDTTDGADITFSGAVTADTFTTAAQGYDIFLNGDATFANAVTFQNTGTLDLGDATSDTLTFNGGLTESTSGTVTIDGAIVSSDDAITFGAINLGQDLSVTSAGGAITIGAITSSSARDVTITSSGGSTNTVTLSTLSGGNMNTIAVTGSTSVTLNGNITTNNSSGNSVTITGTTINTGAITIDTNNTSNDGAINLVGSVAGSNNNLALDSGGAEITLSG
ncbi:uncharacterized protein METZ01_LOCUS218238, partial [marine metagenome]